jgi:NADH:ubiquinone oxidoreductase subunit E
LGSGPDQALNWLHGGSCLVPALLCAFRQTLAEGQTVTDAIRNMLGRPSMTVSVLVYKYEQYAKRSKEKSTVK